MTREELAALCDRFDRLTHLECDGLTRVLLTILDREGIEAEAWSGFIAAGDSRVRHWWLQVGEWTVDYRVRMWLGDGPEIPHGVFHGSAFMAVTYSGCRVQMRPLSDSVFAVLMEPFVWAPSKQ